MNCRDTMSSSQSSLDLPSLPPPSTKCIEVFIWTGIYHHINRGVLRDHQLSLAVPVNSANGPGFVRFSTHQEDAADDWEILDSPWHGDTSFTGTHNGLQSVWRARFQHVGPEGPFLHHIQFCLYPRSLELYGLTSYKGFNLCPTFHEEGPSRNPWCLFYLGDEIRRETIEVDYDPKFKQCIRSLDDLAIASTAGPTDVPSNADGSLNPFGGLPEIYNMRLAAEFPAHSMIMGHNNPPENRPSAA